MSWLAGRPLCTACAAAHGSQLPAVFGQGWAVRLQHLTWHSTFYVPAHNCPRPQLQHDGCFLGKQTLLVHPLQLGYSYALGSGTTGLPLDVLELFRVLH